MLISVIMSVYNTKLYLRESIESILNQSYQDFEFIIIDDGSVDGSRNIIQQYANNDNRIVFIKNKTNIGLAKSLNKGIKIAKGRYIARQDADDISSTIRLETQLNYALAHKYIDVIGSNCFVIDIAGNVVCEIDTYSEIKDHQKRLLNKSAIFPHGSAFIKRNKLIEVGLYDPRFYYSQDGELWLRLISRSAKFYTMDNPLYYYRVMPSQNNKKDNAQRLYNQVKKMIYENNQNKTAINTELLKIQHHIADKINVSTSPYYMAKYWKGLANTIYFNKKINNTNPYKYLYKALKETQPLYNYFDYLRLGVLYAVPIQLVKKFIN
jgi:glycosyltransferase involved in cell wall biosynthesis